MHRYMRAIGFEEPMAREAIDKLCKSIEDRADRISLFQRDDGTVFAEVEQEVGFNMGICLRGEYTDAEQFHREYYFPYLLGTGLSVYDSVTVEQHAEKESYAGVCEDVGLGMNLIFYLQNAVEYKKGMAGGLCGGERMLSVTFSGLSTEGRILLPLSHSKKQVRQPVATDRMDLLNRARSGDEEAIEDLALEDMDIYTSLTKRVKNEDLYSIVDSSFMPYGVECDHYSVFGEIRELKLVKNAITGSRIYLMKVECNDILIDICINQKDLLGEPQVGRRFKGVIWLQGYLTTN
ncbi:MAG: DUF3881 family protein [Lachnospiraceae bacterium]